MKSNVRTPNHRIDTKPRSLSEPNQSLFYLHVLQIYVRDLAELVTAAHYAMVDFMIQAQNESKMYSQVGTPFDLSQEI
jgi:hypothetical protein